MTPVGVRSTNIKSVAYSPETRKLKVAFHSGKTWEYDDVPPEAHQSFIAAQTVGNHFHANIKSRYKGRAVDE